VSTTFQWSELKNRARGLAARGQSEWRSRAQQARERFERMRAPRASTSATEATLDPDLDPGLDRDIEVDPATGTAVIAPHAGLSRALKWTGGVFAALVALLILLAAVWDWDWLRGPLARYASAHAHRSVRIDGHLKVHLLTWTPQIWLSGLKIGNPSWAGPGDVAQVPNLTIKVKLMPLFAGRLDMPLVEIDRPVVSLYSDAQGRANWKGDPTDDKALTLPPIQRLIIRDGHVTLKDIKRKLTLVGTVNTSEDEPGSGRGTFRLQGQGSINAHPFLLRVTGAPLIDVRRDRPYLFDADLKAGDTHILARGQIDKPFNLGAYRTNLTASGADLADLYEITGVALPTTPPYHTTGVFSRDGQTYRYQRFSGRVGSSDLSGEVTVEKRKDRRFLKADLVSRSLDWKDLASVLGGSPAAPEVASPKLEAVAQSLAAQGRILPDSPLDVTRLRSLDADVRFRATAVQANRMKLSQVSLGVKLDHAVLTINPLTFGFAQGNLNGHARIDARNATPVTDLDMTLSNYALQSFLPVRGGAAPASGLIDGRFSLHGSGRSVHETAAGASGTVRFTVPHGELRQAFAELLGINAAKGLSLLLSKDQRKTDLRCALADFDVRGGIMSTRNLVIDTGVVVSHGSGTVNLGAETMNLKLDGHSKRPRLLRLWAPILVRGQLRHPQVSVEKGSIVTQGGVAGALGALVNPLAVVLPFVTLGGAKDVDCAALLSGRAAPTPAHH
jgi:uncharacterized protein involved in outer membrane biogenesis